MDPSVASATLDVEAIQEQDVLVLPLKSMGASSSLVEPMPSADPKMALVSVIVLQATHMEIPTRVVQLNKEVRLDLLLLRGNSFFSFFFIVKFRSRGNIFEIMIRQSMHI